MQSGGNGQSEADSVYVHMQSLSDPVKLQQLLQQYPVLVSVLQSGGGRK